MPKKGKSKKLKNGKNLKGGMAPDAVVHSNPLHAPVLVAPAPQLNRRRHPRAELWLERFWRVVWFVFAYLVVSSAIFWWRYGWKALLSDGGFVNAITFTSPPDIEDGDVGEQCSDDSDCKGNLQKGRCGLMYYHVNNMMQQNAAAVTRNFSFFKEEELERDDQQLPEAGQYFQTVPGWRYQGRQGASPGGDWKRFDEQEDDEVNAQRVWQKGDDSSVKVDLLNPEYQCIAEEVPPWRGDRRVAAHPAPDIVLTPQETNSPGAPCTQIEGHPGETDCIDGYCGIVNGISVCIGANEHGGTLENSCVGDCKYIGQQCEENKECISGNCDTGVFNHEEQWALEGNVLFNKNEWRRCHPANGYGYACNKDQGCNSGNCILRSQGEGSDDGDLDDGHRTCGDWQVGSLAPPAPTPTPMPPAAQLDVGEKCNESNECLSGTCTGGLCDWDCGFNTITPAANRGPEDCYPTGWDDGGQQQPPVAEDNPCIYLDGSPTCESATNVGAYPGGAVEPLIPPCVGTDNYDQRRDIAASGSCCDLNRDESACLGADHTSNIRRYHDIVDEGAGKDKPTSQHHNHIPTLDTWLAPSQANSARFPVDEERACKYTSHEEPLCVNPTTHH